MEPIPKPIDEKLPAEKPSSQSPLVSSGKTPTKTIPPPQDKGASVKPESPPVAKSSPRRKVETRNEKRSSMVTPSVGSERRRRPSKARTPNNQNKPPTYQLKVKPAEPAPTLPATKVVAPPAVIPVAPVEAPPPPRASMLEVKTKIKMMLRIDEEITITNYSLKVHAIVKEIQSSGYHFGSLFVPRLIKNYLFYHQTMIQADETLIARDYGIRFPKITKNTLSNHPRARIARAAADLYLLEQANEIMSRNPNITEIVDLYGSRRFLDKAKPLNQYIKDVAGPKTPQKLFWYRPIITANDHLRYKNQVLKHPSKEPSHASVVIAQDLYNQTPQEFLLDLYNWQVSDIFLCVMIYDGRVTAGMTHGEGPYIQRDGKFYCFPGDDEQQWIPNESNLFWLERSDYQLPHGTTASWCKIKQIGEYHIFHIALIKERIPVQMTLTTPPIPTSALVIERPYPEAVTYVGKIRRKILSFLKEEFNPLMTFEPAVKSLTTTMIATTRLPYQLTELKKLVENLVNKPEYAIFWKMTNLDKAKVTQDTITYLTWNTFSSDMSALSSAVALYGEAVIAFKNMKNKMVDGFSMNYGRIAAGIGLIFLISKIISKLSALAQLPTFVVDCLRTRLPGGCYHPWDFAAMLVFGPIFEEISKRGSFFFTVCAGLMESISTTVILLENSSMENWLKVFGAIGFKIGIHHLMAQSPPEVHSLWNAMCMLRASPTLHTFSGCFSSLAATSMLVRNRNGELRAVPPWLDKIAKACGLGFCLVNCWTTYIARNTDVMKKVANDFFDPYPLNLIPKCAAYLTSFFPEAPSSNMTHLNNVFFRAAPPLADFIDVFKQSQQKHFVLETHIPLKPEEAFIPSNLIDPVENSLYEFVKKEVGQYVVASSPAMFERPCGYYHFQRALELRNRASVPALTRCEQGDSTYKIPCNFDGYVGTRCEIHSQWRQLYKNVRPIIKVRIAPLMREDGEFYESWKMSRAEWVQHFNAAMQRSRAKDAVARRAEGNIQIKSSVFLKGDEVLCPKDLGDGSSGIKGRLVKAVDPTIQADACIEIDRAMKLLKMIFHKPFELNNGWEVQLSIGSGKNSGELSQWFTEQLIWVNMRQKRASFIFAGDDTFFMVNDTIVNFGEIDFSKYDRTQGTHALRFECDILRLLLCTPKVVNNLYKACTATAVYEEKTLGIRERITMPIQRATGGPDTTLGNSINNAFTTFSLFLENDPKIQNLPSKHATYGFEAKFKLSTSFMGMTFLKGAWFPQADQFVWLPLPSQAIKLGKLLTDPRKIFTSDPPPVAWRKVAYALASGLGNVPFSFPILGKLRWLYVTMGIENDQKLKENWYRLEVDLSADDLDMEFVLAFYMERYKITPCEIEEVHADIEKVLEYGIPIMLPSNPAWAKLWSDYE